MYEFVCDSFLVTRRVSEGQSIAPSPSLTLSGYQGYGLVEALLLKHLMPWFAAADEVGGQVEDFVFVHSIKQTIWHR